MKIRLIVGIMLLLMVKMSCKSKNQIEAYDLNPIIKDKFSIKDKTDSLIKLELCNSIPFKWDSIIVLPPYSSEENLKNLNLINVRDLEEKFPYSKTNRFPLLTIDEGACVLLFVKKNRIINYSRVARTPLDFRDLIKKDDLIGTITRKDMCNKLFLRKCKDTLNSASLYKIFIDR